MQRCTYCGELATTVDHIPPRALRPVIPASECPWVEVPACGECNSALNARRLLTVSDRCRWIVTYLKRKYSKDLNLPEWPDSDVQELGLALRRRVRAGLVRKQGTLDRVAYAAAKARA